MCNKSIICGVLFASGAIAFYEGNNMLSALLWFLWTLCHGQEKLHRDPPNPSTSWKNFISPPIKIYKSKCFPSTSVLAFSYNVFIFWKMGLQARFKWSESSLQFTMQKTFWSFDDNVKSSVITEKNNTTKFEILLTFAPSPEILIFILSLSGFTWYLMYWIGWLSRLTYPPGIFHGILSKWNKLLISSCHWWN